MELQTLIVKTRESNGKGAARRARRTGQVPGVVYGEAQPPLTISIDTKNFDHLIHGEMGEHAVVQLEVEDKPDLSGPALIKSVQHHPVRLHVLHADFMRIRLDARIRTFVPIALIGRCKGMQEGGVPDQQLHELEVECVALDVPAHIDVDITELHIGDSIHVAQLQAPKGVDIVTDPERAVIAIHPPRVLEEAAMAPEEAEEAAEEAEKEAAEAETE